jgi:hypothetical protein
MKESVKMDVAPCCLADIYRRFRGAYCLHYQGADFRPEDGGSMFLRNVGIYLQAHAALQPRGPTSTILRQFNVLRGRVVHIRSGP